MESDRLALRFAVGQPLLLSIFDSAIGSTGTGANPRPIEATDFAMMETSGKAATVRVSVSVSDGAQLAAGGSIDATLAPNEFRLFSGLLRTVLGDARETALGDMRNVHVSFQVD